MRPTNIPPYSEAVSEIEKSCKDALGGLIETYYNQMSGSSKRILSKGYKTAMWLSMITIIIGPIMYMIRAGSIAKINSLVESEIGSEKIYASALEGTDTCEITGTGTIPSNIHYALRVDSVPSDARVINSFDGLKGVSSKQTDIISNAVKFKWIRTNGKNTQVYYYTQAMMIVGCDFMNKFEFDLKRESLATKMSRREKKKLENREFEKKFSIKNNDEVKLRQSFTPMVQENYVKYTSEKALKQLRIIKSGNLLYIVWGTREDYLKVQGSELDDGSLGDIIEMIWTNVKKDLSEFYTASAYAFSLPFYKPEKKTKQGNLDEPETHDRLKKGFVATVLAESANGV